MKGAAALGLVVLLAALAATATRVSVLVVDLPGQRGTLVVGRSALPGLRLLDTPDAVCRRQGPGSPLRSIYLGDDFCRRAVVLSLEPGSGAGSPGLRLPYSGALHTLAGR